MAEDSKRVAVAGGGPLGTYTNYASPYVPSGQISSGLDGGKDARLMRWALLDEAAKLLPDSRVPWCFRSPVPNQEIAVYHSSSRGSASYGGLIRCGSVWVCPVCAAIISERRRHELECGIANARGVGLVAYLETFTVQHARYDRLAPLLDALLSAMRSLVGAKAAMAFKRRHGVVGTVRALEVTYGANGWHPHSHRLTFFPEDQLPGEDYVTAMRARWQAVAARHGLRMNEHGYDMRVTGGAVGDYVAKWGHEPAIEAPWGVAAELSKAHIKRGRGDSLTPFGLLRASYGGDHAAGRRFIEYAAVFKGRRQLLWSDHLRGWLGLDEGELTDNELVQLTEEDTELLGFISIWQWRRVVKYGARGYLLEVARGGRWDDVRAFLVTIGAASGEAAV